jgi:hypothetical protein
MEKENVEYPATGLHSVIKRSKVLIHITKRISCVIEARHKRPHIIRFHIHTQNRQIYRGRK